MKSAQCPDRLCYHRTDQARCPQPRRRRFDVRSVEVEQPYQQLRLRAALQPARTEEMRPLSQSGHRCEFNQHLGDEPVELLAELHVDVL